MLTTCAQRAGFGGGVVVDYPNSAKKRKMYLCLMVGSQEIPRGLTGEEIEVDGKDGKKGVKNEHRRKKDAALKGRELKKKAKKGIVDKEWILKKKDLYRARGKDGVPLDSKVSFVNGSHSISYTTDKVHHKLILHLTFFIVRLSVHC